MSESVVEPSDDTTLAALVIEALAAALNVKGATAAGSALADPIDPRIAGADTLSMVLPGSNKLGSCRNGAAGIKPAADPLLDGATEGNSGGGCAAADLAVCSAGSTRATGDWGRVAGGSAAALAPAVLDPVPGLREDCFA